MKHLYILALGGLLSFSAQAQFNQPSAAAKEDMAPRQKVTNVQTNVERETIWANDISDCATWSFGNGSMEVGQPWTDIDISFEWHRGSQRSLQRMGGQQRCWNATAWFEQHDLRQRLLVD